MAGAIETGGSGEKLKIYFLPNLMTAGNLACGFFALTWIFKYDRTSFEPIHVAIRLILAAFAFDFEREPDHVLCLREALLHFVAQLSHLPVELHIEEAVRLHRLLESIFRALAPS